MAMHDPRPPFPSGWSSLPMSLSNLTLANTLPVGQSFLWHRRSLLPSPPASTSSSPSLSSPIAAPNVEGEDEKPLLRSDEEYSRAITLPRSRTSTVLLLRQTPSHLYYTALGAPEGEVREWIIDYFQLERYPDLPALYAGWRRRDPEVFGRMEVERGRASGVRVLRQDPWECLVAFITSTNNHIPRISSLLHKLSSHFSPVILELPDPSPLTPTQIPAGTTTPPLSSPSTTSYRLFPRPHHLHVLDKPLEPTLRALGFGYRANFIEATLNSLREAFGDKPGGIEQGLEEMRAGGAEGWGEVRERLCGLKGVGRKVADCVGLMCLDQPSLIPVDTHIAAIASRHPAFPSRLKNKPMSSKAVYDEVQAFLQERWGDMGGWCQAVVFAADLKEHIVTPKKRPAMIIGLPDGGLGLSNSTTTSTGSPMSTTLLATPKEEEKPLVVGELGREVVHEDGSPLKSKRRQGKRKSEAQPGLEMGSQAEDGDVPAVYGFKRTRSAAKLDLARRNSGRGA